MKIGIFVEFYTPHVSGVVTSVDTLVNWLMDEGHEAVIFAPYIRGHKDRARSKIVRVPSIGFGKGKMAWPWLTSKLFKKIKAMNLDLIHIQGPYPTGFLGKAAAKRLGIPVALTYHTDIVQTIPVILGPLFNPLLPLVRSIVQWQIKHCFNPACFVISPSKYVLKLMQKRNLDLSKVVVMPTPVPIPKNRLKTLEARKKLKLPLDKKIMVHVSRISREKNYFFLLSAMKEVFSEMPDAYLVFIGGGGSLSKKVKREVRRLGLEKNIMFAGELARAKVDEYYAAADILVLSSLMETQGLVMSEAAALGKPSVIVRSGGAVEYVKNLNDGLITKIDKHEYARAVLRLLKNPALSKQYGENGFKNVKTGLSPDVIYPKLITLYKNALKENTQ